MPGRIPFQMAGPRRDACALRAGNASGRCDVPVQFPWDSAGGLRIPSEQLRFEFEGAVRAAGSDGQDVAANGRPRGGVWLAFCAPAEVSAPWKRPEGHPTSGASGVGNPPLPVLAVGRPDKSPSSSPQAVHIGADGVSTWTRQRCAQNNHDEQTRKRIYDRSRLCLYREWRLFRC